MSKSKAGPIITVLIVAGVALVFVLNREPSSSSGDRPGPDASKAAGDGVQTRAAFRPGPVREYPIGDEVIKNHLEIAAVWLPSVSMAGMPEPASGVIHVEADVRATADNPNGPAKDEKIPYLKVSYRLIDEGGKALDSGELMPMWASDGFHYGANIARPIPGRYRLVYALKPPSASGVGQHVDPATGVARWWEPFEVSFDWTMEPTENPPPAVEAAQVPPKP